jgi:hypothetical protein
MTVLLITALRAAETLVNFHRQCIENAAGEARAYHEVTARRCAVDAERITREILVTGVTVENQATAMGRRDLETAQGIIDRHVIMHGVGIHADNVPAARTAMARDIADALLGGTGRGGIVTWESRPETAQAFADRFGGEVLAAGN